MDLLGDCKRRPLLSHKRHRLKPLHNPTILPLPRNAAPPCSHDALFRRLRRKGLQVHRHQTTGGLSIGGQQRLQNRRVLEIASPEIVIAVFSHLVRQPLVGPAVPQNLAHRQIAAEFRYRKMDCFIKPSRRHLPHQFVGGPGIPAEKNQIVQNRRGDQAATRPRGLRLHDLTHPVDVDQPILGAGANDGAQVWGLLDDSARGQPGQSFHDRSPRHFQLRRQARRLEFDASGQISADDFEQDAIMRQVGQGALLGISDGVFAKERLEFRVTPDVEEVGHGS